MHRYLLACVLASLATVAPAFGENKIVGSFDGYCEGFIVVLKKNGAVAGETAGCSPAGKMAGLWSSSQLILSPPAIPPAIFLINNKPRTFFVYNARGKIAYKGTWSPGLPPTPPNSPSIFSVLGAK